MTKNYPKWLQIQFISLQNNINMNRVHKRRHVLYECLFRAHNARTWIVTVHPHFICTKYVIMPRYCPSKVLGSTPNVSKANIFRVGLFLLQFEMVAIFRNSWQFNMSRYLQNISVKLNISVNIWNYMSIDEIVYITVDKEYSYTGFWFLSDW
jgi:hypothetical protein